MLTCGNDLVSHGKDFLTPGNKIKNDRKTVLFPSLGSVSHNNEQFGGCLIKIKQILSI